MQSSRRRIRDARCGRVRGVSDGRRYQLACQPHPPSGVDPLRRTGVGLRG
jgi:hypothetical protein